MTTPTLQLSAPSVVEGETVTLTVEFPAESSVKTINLKQSVNPLTVATAELTVENATPTVACEQGEATYFLDTGDIACEQTGPNEFTLTP